MLALLSAHRFRNLERLEWEPPDGSCLLLGGNGAGKTSVLEIVHLVATTRSFRSSQLADCARRSESDEEGEQGFFASATIEGERRADLTVSWGPGGLVRSLNGKSVSLPEYLETLPVVAWTAREDEILAGVPERRRRMIDSGLVTELPARLSALSTFRRTLAQKRELLRRRHGGLEEWNELFAAAAAELIELRGAYVERLSAALVRCLQASGLPFPEVRLRYQPSPVSGREGAEAVLLRLEEQRAEELRLGRPLVGPHLDRLSIDWHGVDVSRVASAGERKALGLLLVAAQAELLEAAQRGPLLLADDVDAELDLEVLRAVWRVLAQGRRVLASSNRREVAATLEGVVVQALENGRTVAEL
jgi:DNA replication and repair protein RecF